MFYDPGLGQLANHGSRSGTAGYLDKLPGLSMPDWCVEISVNPKRGSTDDNQQQQGYGNGEPFHHE
jgi:hypothetical protein